MKGPMCAWGMTSTDEHGKGLVKKETCWVTNSEHIARILDRECSNVRSQQVSGRALAVWHRHVHLVNQRAHGARFYPPLLVAGILRGARAQLEATGGVMNFAYPVPEDPVIPWEPELDEELEVYWNDSKGGY